MSESKSARDDYKVRVLDPKDYAQNRRLKQIHDARDRTRQVLHKGQKRLRSDDWRGFREEEFRESYARAVIQYGVEVEPVIIRSESNLLERELPNQEKYATVKTVTIKLLLDSGGKVNDEYIPIDGLRWVKREFDKELGKVGVGLEISEDKEPAQI